MSALTLLLFTAGAAALIGGAELLVRGAARLATALGFSPLVVGLTVVAFATSSPELAVTVDAARAGQAEVALGNVVGSNIFNILMILGLSAAIAPLQVARQLVRLDVPIMIGVSAVVALLALDGRISPTEGALLLLGLAAYLALLVLLARRESAAAAPAQGAREPARWARDLLFMAAGLVLLVVGARWLVGAAVEIAGALGVSPLVIGLTVVAGGTSLPELATSVLASLRGARDIAVGNVVGSNIFNLLGVLGAGGVVAQGGVPVPAGALTFDLPVMLGVSLAALPIFFTGLAIARWEGFVFLGFYALYTLFLILDAAQHEALPHLREAVVLFVLPLTALTLAVLTARALSLRRR